MKTKTMLEAENKELWDRLEEKDEQIAYDKKYIEKLRINFDEARKKYYDPSVRDKAQIIGEMFKTQMEVKPAIQKQARSDSATKAANVRYADKKLSPGTAKALKDEFMSDLLNKMPAKTICKRLSVQQWEDDKYHRRMQHAVDKLVTKEVKTRQRDEPDKKPKEIYEDMAQQYQDSGAHWHIIETLVESALNREAKEAPK